MIPGKGSNGITGCMQFNNTILNTKAIVWTFSFFYEQLALTLC